MLFLAQPSTLLRLFLHIELCIGQIIFMMKGDGGEQVKRHLERRWRLVTMLVLNQPRGEAISSFLSCGQREELKEGAPLSSSACALNWVLGSGVLVTASSLQLKKMVISGTAVICLVHILVSIKVLVGLSLTHAHTLTPPAVGSGSEVGFVFCGPTPASTPDP